MMLMSLSALRCDEEVSRQKPNFRLSGTIRSGNALRVGRDPVDQASVAGRRGVAAVDPVVEILIVLREHVLVEREVVGVRLSKLGGGEGPQNQVHLLHASPRRSHPEALQRDLVGHAVWRAAVRSFFSIRATRSAVRMSCDFTSRSSVRSAVISAGTSASSGDERPSPSPVRSQRIDTLSRPASIWSLFARGSARSFSQARIVLSFTPRRRARSSWLRPTASRAPVMRSPNVAASSEYQPVSLSGADVIEPPPPVSS